MHWLGGTVEERGQTGDQFGAINALFSGLAFAGLITTLLLQRQELELQRRELALTRQEYTETKEHVKAQSDTLAKQKFRIKPLPNDPTSPLDCKFNEA